MKRVGGDRSVAVLLLDAVLFKFYDLCHSKQPVLTVLASAAFLYKSWGNPWIKYLFGTNCFKITAVDRSTQTYIHVIELQERLGRLCSMCVCVRMQEWESMEKGQTLAYIFKVLLPDLILKEAI